MGTMVEPRLNQGIDPDRKLLSSQIDDLRIAVANMGRDLLAFVERIVGW